MDRPTRIRAVDDACFKTLRAIEWLYDARTSAGDVNGELAYERRADHARKLLREAVEALDGKRTITPMQRPVEARR